MRKKSGENFVKNYYLDGRTFLAFGLVKIVPDNPDGLYDGLQSEKHEFMEMIEKSVLNNVMMLSRILHQNIKTKTLRQHEILNFQLLLTPKLEENFKID